MINLSLIILDKPSQVGSVETENDNNKKDLSTLSDNYKAKNQVSTVIINKYMTVEGKWSKENLLKVGFSS